MAKRPRWEKEQLSDNTQVVLCKQCRDCRWWGNADAFSNRHDKGCCDKYPYPACKPNFVLMDTDKCVFREVRP